MGRPSISNVRRHQILEAFVWCVAHYGLHGATQERIAEKAEVKRSILRHYLGNKDEIIESLVSYVVARYDSQLQALKESLPKTERVRQLVQNLIGPRSQVDQNLGLCFQALAVHCSGTPRGNELEFSMRAFVSLVEDEVKSEFPRASKKERQAATMTFVSIYLAAESLAPFPSRDEWLQWAEFAAAQQLQFLQGKKV